MIWYHIVAFSIGVLLDFIIGDPHWLPHPIRLIGALIGKLDKALLEPALQKASRNAKVEKRKGELCVLVVLLSTTLVTAALIIGAYMIHIVVGMVIESLLTGYCLAARSLQMESMKVYKELQKGDMEGARTAVSMIVGRDTAVLDEQGIIKAAVETVAENTSDGVIAPMLYLLLGGPILGLMYKAINTMDSMIAYHNERYEHFGRCAAKLDDAANFIPARLSAVLMILASYLKTGCSGRNAYTIFKRDRFNHKSPNSAQTESVAAGALQVQLAGDAYYFGKLVEKPYIGDPTREIEKDDIKRMNQLMYWTMLLLFLVGEVVLVSLGYLMR